MSQPASLARIRGAGVVTRHARRCTDPREHGCPCGPGYEAWVFDRRRGKKRRKTFRSEAEARDWRIKQLRRLYADTAGREGRTDVAYGLLRRTMLEVDAAINTASASERALLREALSGMYVAEDALLSARVSGTVGR